MAHAMFIIYFNFRKQINPKTEKSDHGLLSMVIDQCIVQMLIKMIVLTMKQSLESASLSFVGKFIAVNTVYYVDFSQFVVKSYTDNCILWI